MRHLPPAAIAILAPLMERPRTTQQVEADLSRTQVHDGWRSPAWEPLQPWTDEELAAQRADPDFGDADDDADAETVNAEEAADRAARVAELDRYSQRLGLAPVRTIGDLLELMVACRLLTRTGEGAEAVLDFNPAAPLPAEVLPLTAEERAKEDQLRWRSAYEPIAGSIIGLFEPDAEVRPDRLRTSLQRLARQLEVDAESARAGVLLLLEDGDFTANRDVERLAEHQVFELAVDWETFDRDRMHFRLTAPGSASE
jgi:hypothetical protein